MKKDLYYETTMAHKDEPLVAKYLKRIQLNKILWTVGFALSIGLAIAMIILAFKIPFEGAGKIAAIAVPLVAMVMIGIVTVLIWLGNRVGIKMYNNNKIMFYSGFLSNHLYINEQLIVKASDDSKLQSKLSDGTLVQIHQKTISYKIDTISVEEQKAKVAQAAVEPTKETPKA